MNIFSKILKLSEDFGFGNSHFTTLVLKFLNCRQALCLLIFYLKKEHEGIHGPFLSMESIKQTKKN